GDSPVRAAGRQLRSPRDGVGVPRGSPPGRWQRRTFPPGARLRRPPRTLDDGADPGSWRQPDSESLSPSNAGHPRAPGAICRRVMGAVDAHVHVFPSSRDGLIAQGGTPLVGYDGVAEELAEIFARGRVSRALAVLALPVELSRRARRSRLPVDVSPAERGRLEEEVEERVVGRAL